MWFIYPETANVRLEDMNSLFGDATSAMPTPATLAEAESLFSGRESPVPSLDIRRQGLGADNAIPGLDIDPPVGDGHDGPGAPPAKEHDAHEGIGGWISNMVKRGKGNGEGGDSQSAQYRQVGQDDED